ncbi:uncharacterized protein A4U43_UnF9490 [Asparagus officinalis]|uniref:VPS37 C-terminal domain-containing protein n=1 Tax=Asparagus officinalis TaxID=4686 RepID=A0A1R3L5Q0_ASPOF|nr:vacuolar protein-sorting-associated protein 37 homolog 1-like isoform X2 [Asparagus officinalis]ONK54940.1 uncharacterized protein A4U43_UnF9490 [Asparagus officinalis]
MSFQSLFPSLLLGTSNSSHPSTLTSSSSMSSYRASDRPQSPSTGSPSPEAAGIIAHLKDKSTDELRKLLTDKNVYKAFFNSLDLVKDQRNLSRELQEETMQLARENLEKETRMSELRNQCMIIRTTELADAQEKLKELEKQKDEILRFYSPLLMLQSLQDAMNKDEEESETLHKKLLEKEIDLTTFLQKYNKLRNDYHRRALVHLAAKTSVM